MNYLKELRKSKGLKQHELAAKLNVTKQNISFLENKERVRETTIIKFISGLDMTFEDYLKFVEEKEKQKKK